MHVVLQKDDCVKGMYLEYFAPERNIRRYYLPPQAGTESLAV